MAHYELRSRTPSKSDTRARSSSRGRTPHDQGYETGEEDIAVGTAARIRQALGPHERKVAYAAGTTVLTLAVTLRLTCWEHFAHHFDGLAATALPNHPAWIKHQLVRFSVLDLFSSAVACSTFRLRGHFPKFWLETLVACTILQFGGTTLAHVLVLGRTPSWINSVAAFPSLVLMWLLTFYCPKDAWYKYIMKNVYLAYLVNLGAWASSVHSITTWGMHKAITAEAPTESTSPFVLLFTAILAGSGGMILGELLSVFDKEWDLRRPSYLQHWSFSFQKVVLGALAYYFLIQPGVMLFPEELFGVKIAGQFKETDSAIAAAKAYVYLGFVFLSTLNHFDSEFPIFEPVQNLLDTWGLTKVDPKRRRKAHKKSE